MVRKYPKKRPWTGSVIKGVILAETVLLLGSFHVWKRLCNERDYRKYYLENRPRMLEWYYWSLEHMSGTSPRIADYNAWKLPLAKDSLKKNDV